MSENKNNSKKTESYIELSNSFNEINYLIEMASSIQDAIKYKRREIRISFVKLASLLYFFIAIAIAIPILIKPIITNIIGFYGYLSILLFSLTTLFFLSFILVMKIRELRVGLKVDIATIQELMEVIFNLRKIFNNFEKLGLSIVEVTILDLKLRQLRFH